MIRDSGSSPDKGSSWESYTYNRIVNRKLCFPSSGQRALFSPRFARGLHPLPWNILRLKQVELARRYSRRSRGSMCLGFPQARNRNGSWEWTFPVVRPERSARGLTQSRGIAWDPRISGAAPRTRPRHRKHDIYRGLGHRYADDDDDQGHLCARIRFPRIFSSWHSKSTYLIVL